MRKQFVYISIILAEIITIISYKKPCQKSLILLLCVYNSINKCLLGHLLSSHKLWSGRGLIF